MAFCIEKYTFVRINGNIFSLCSGFFFVSNIFIREWRLNMLFE